MDAHAGRRAAASRKEMERQQKTVTLTKEGPTDVDTKDFCGAFAALNVDNSWDHGVFKKGFSIEILHFDEELVKFFMTGLDPPLLNAFRRILLSEVPTVAISGVTIFQNTSVIHDENFAHRLGLIPIKFEPESLEWKAPDAEWSDLNSLCFELKAVCDQSKGEKRKSVYSGDMQWRPMSAEQAALFKDDPPRPVADDILLTQLGAGQEIEVECFCEKGIGQEHAKWSPVCTAHYRLRSEIEFTTPITGDDAEFLKEVCPMGVFDIEDLPTGEKRAFVTDPRKCTTCRQCLDKFPGDDKGLKLTKVKDECIFSIESSGCVPAPLLFERAIAKLREKCLTSKTLILAKAKKPEE